MDNTPFEIVGAEKQGYFGALGKFRITEVFKNEEDVEEYIKSNTYHVMLLLITILIPEFLKQEQTKETVNN